MKSQFSNHLLQEAFPDCHLALWVFPPLPSRLCLSTVCVSCSAVSSSSQPRGLQPARLLCPWDFPGQNTGVGCHPFHPFSCMLYSTHILHLLNPLLTHSFSCLPNRVVLYLSAPHQPRSFTRSGLLLGCSHGFGIGLSPKQGHPENLWVNG